MKFTIIVPAFNEEARLGPTLDSIRAASELLRARRGEDSYVIVVDNNSTDGTSAVARSKGATVVHEPVQSISRARNTGARHATGNVLVFIDADVMVPRTLRLIGLKAGGRGWQTRIALRTARPRRSSPRRAS